MKHTSKIYYDDLKKKLDENVKLIKSIDDDVCRCLSCARLENKNNLEKDMVVIRRAVNKMLNIIYKG